MSCEIVQIDATIVACTERTVLVRTANQDDAIWLSLAQVEVTPSGFDGIHTITMPAWLAMREGLV